MLRSFFRVAPLLALLMGCCWTLRSSRLSFHGEIDAAVEAGSSGLVAGTADDAEFLRRVYLDFSGSIPTADKAKAFLADPSPSKRSRLIGQLAANPNFARRMQQVFSVMLLERRNGQDVALADWDQFLLDSFTANKPLDQLARDILSADAANDLSRPTSKFYLDRAGDLDRVTRDVSRLFLGKDIECAHCHDHPRVAEYKQDDYYGLYTYLIRSFVHKSGKKVFYAEAPSADPKEYFSVFKQDIKKKTRPHLAGEPEIVEPTYAKEEAIAQPAKDGTPAIPKFSARAQLAKDLANPNNKAFTRNLANRLWALMMGRGVVHPLDWHHRGNPPSNPLLLDLLADQLVECKFDARIFLSELALTRTYQRSSLLPVGAEEAEHFAVAGMKPLSAEQLFASILTATGEARRPRQDFESSQQAFVAIFGAPAGEPEGDFQPSIAHALFLSNEKAILQWLKPRPGNLMDHLEKLPEAGAVAEELYLSILTRPPTSEEKLEVASHLQQRAAQRGVALQELAWALLASTEFRLNH